MQRNLPQDRLGSAAPGCTRGFERIRADVLLHGCRIGAKSLIGNGAIVLDAAQIGSSSIVAAGALVPPRMVVPDGVVVMGSPAKVVREVSAKDLEMIARASAHYVSRSAEFRQGLRTLPEV